MTENIGEWLLYPPPPLYTVTKMIQYNYMGRGCFSICLLNAILRNITQILVLFK